MSAPHDDPDVPSLNSLISKEEFTLSYIKLDDAIEVIQRLGRYSKLCKTDLVDAFKNMPVHPTCWPYQGVKWEGKYYFYTRLVFGCRSSPKIFDHLSRAIAWIAHHNYDIANILYLLDDFLTIDEPNHESHRTMALLTLILRKIGAEYALHKTCGPSYALEYLGLWVDTVAMECRLPKDKLTRTTNMVSQFLGKRTCFKHELLSLLGHLAFAARVIPAGRSFMFRLFKAAYSVEQLHHRAYLNIEAREDLKMWASFLRGWDGVSLFLNLHVTYAPELDLYTDAASTKGFGGYYQGQWFACPWGDRLNNLDEAVSMCYEELYPIVIAAILWGKYWSRKKIVFHCDNQATIGVLRKGASKSRDVMKLARKLTIIAATHSFSFQGEYIRSEHNNIADALSRLQMDRFRKLAPHAAAEPCTIPTEVCFL